LAGLWFISDRNAIASATSHPVKTGAATRTGGYPSFLFCGVVVQRFIHDKNLAHFLRRLLAEQKNMNAERHQLILELLAEEEGKDAIDRGSQDTSVWKLSHAP
jgi:hypothetical protein